MRKTLVRLGVAIAATAAPLALMAPAAHAIGGCNLGDGIDRENGSEWQERADENGVGTTTSARTAHPFSPATRTSRTTTTSTSLNSDTGLGPCQVLARDRSALRGIGRALRRVCAVSWARAPHLPATPPARCRGRTPNHPRPVGRGADGAHDGPLLVVEQPCQQQGVILDRSASSVTCCGNAGSMASAMVATSARIAVTASVMASTRVTPRLEGVDPGG
jgi:hypothetical protein